MAAQSFYGSSEYSARAEELFARYVRQQEHEADPDFEAYCAEHADFADELIGLHTDWDNVRGLLTRLKALEGAAQRTTACQEPIAASALPQADESQGAASAEPLLPLADESTPAPVLLAQNASAGWPRAWASLALVLLIAAAALGYWNRNLWLGNELLAVERQELQARSESTEQRLWASQEEAQRLREREQQLGQALTSERTENELMVRAQSELNAREQELRSAYERLGASHLELDREYREVQQVRLHLDQAYQAERVALERASAESLLAQARLEALGELAKVEDLVRREASFLHNDPLTPVLLRAWQAEARVLGSKRAMLQETLADLALESSSVARWFEALKQLESPGGALQRAGLRLERLDKLQLLDQGEHASRWSAALASIGDATQATRYGGMQLEPQWGLVPLELEAESGLWRFADWLTGSTQSDATAAAALSFYLIPGGELDGELCEAFLLASAAPQARHFQAAGSAHALWDSEQVAWAKLGLRTASPLELEFSRRAGLLEEHWARLPVRSLQP